MGKLSEEAIDVLANLREDVASDCTRGDVDPHELEVVDEIIRACGLDPEKLKVM